MSTLSIEERISWWQEARFGMFVHWGLYSVNGLECWKMHDMGIPASEYLRLEPEFTAKGFSGKAIADAALSGGCKYVVMGSRHHEGYCLWDTATTDFSSVKMTPKRDLIGEYVHAVRGAGLGVGFYYSLLDWRYKAYWEGPNKDPSAWSKLVEYVHAQVRELMTNYGKIDVLWFDGHWDSTDWGIERKPELLAKAWRSEELLAMVRKLQPGILINNRTGLDGDFGTPEQQIVPEARPWELCDTMPQTWGWCPQDKNRKSVHELLRRLIQCVAFGGNMLLNIGPKPDGSLQAWQLKLMAQIGEWMKVHGESIYGCSAEPAIPLNNGLAPWMATRKGDNLYVHLVRYPGSSFGIANLHGYWFESAELLDTGAELKITREPTRDILSGLPARSPDPIAAVVKIRTRPMTEAEKAARRHVGQLGF